MSALPHVPPTTPACELSTLADICPWPKTRMGAVEMAPMNASPRLRSERLMCAAIAARSTACAARR
jgi:hypothetical protein